MEIKLIPKTAKAKQRIKAHGDTGRVIQTVDKVQFDSKKGPWLLVEAGDPTSRWVHATQDANFTVENIL